MLRLGVTVFASAALCAVLAGSASAATIIEPMGSQFPYQRWADESKMTTPNLTLEVIPTSAARGCPSRDFEYAGCTSPAEGKIWLVESELIGKHPRQTFYHELGHNIDFDLLPEWMRTRYMAIMALEGPWRTPAEPE